MFNFFKKDDYVDLQKQRNEIFENLKKKLKNELKFTPDEIDEVESLQRRFEIKVVQLKKSVAHVNENNDNTEDDLKTMTDKMNEYATQLAKDIQEKIKEIVDRKLKG